MLTRELRRGFCLMLNFRFVSKIKVPIINKSAVTVTVAVAVLAVFAPSTTMTLSVRLEAD
jgi:hypothetical protein